MTDFTETPYDKNERIYHPIGQVNQAYRLTSRTYATSDTVKVLKLERDVKIVNGYIANVDSLGATAEFDLVVTDGTTTKVIVDGADLSSAATVQHMNDIEAAGWVTDNRDYWLEVRAISVATAAEDIIIVGLLATCQMLEDEGPLS